MNTVDDQRPAWRLMRIPHVEEEVILLFDRLRASDALRLHPGKTIYFPKELDELARGRDAEDYPKLMALVHGLKSAFRGRIVPKDQHNVHGGGSAPPNHPPGSLGDQLWRPLRGLCIVCGSGRFWQRRGAPSPLCETCHPPACEEMVWRRIVVETPSERQHRQPVSEKATAKVNEIRHQAMALGWTHAALYRQEGHHPFPCGQGYGLVCFLESNRSVGTIHPEWIEVIHQSPDGRQSILRFRNPDVDPLRIRRTGETP